jgi:hypothetical protein
MATYNSEQAKIARARAIADALRASGNEPIAPSIRTGGRFDAPVSGWAHANRALSTLLGAYEGRQADKRAEKLDQEDKRAAEAPETNQELDPSIQSEEGPTRAPQAVVPTAAERKAKLQAATMRGMQFGGSAAPYAQEITQRELFPAVKTDYTLGYGDKRIDANTNAVLATGEERPTSAPAEDRALLPFVATTVADATPEELKAGRALRPRAEFKKGMVPWVKPNAGSGPPQTSLALDPETLDNAARDVIRMGPSAMTQYVSRAAQDKPTRDAINNMATKIARDAGMTNNEVAQFRNRVAAEARSTKLLVETKNAVESFETLARANGQRLLELVKDVNVTGIPAFEGVARAIKNKLGDEDAAEFMSVLNVYQTEMARIVTQPRLVGQLSDSAREEMQRVVDGKATPAQMFRVVKRLEVEMDIRKQGLDDQLARSANQLSIPASAPPTPVTPTPEDVDGDDYSGLWGNGQ